MQKMAIYEQITQLMRTRSLCGYSEDPHISLLIELDCFRKTSRFTPNNERHMM